MEKKYRKRVGLLGGTFNPVHLGHLRAAEEIREVLTLDKVYFIPSSIPPHKDSEGIISPNDRLKMLELSIQGNPFFEISDVELKRGGASYTIDTLKHFSSTFPEFEFYFIVGNELFFEIDTWKDFKQLFELSNFTVITRPGFSEDFSSLIPLAVKDDFRYYKKEKDVTIYLHKSSKALAIVQIEGIPVSSTQIRDILRDNKSIKYLVPAPVESYILSKKLYVKEAVLNRV
jgi:nicotinate-nucleotide adenylyltransferase